MNRVTKQLIEQLKVSDSVDVYLGWVRGTLTKYEIDPAKDNVKPAAHFEVKPDCDGPENIVFESFHIEGDEQNIRLHLGKEAYARFTVKRVRTECP